MSAIPTCSGDQDLRATQRLSVAAASSRPDQKIVASHRRSVGAAPLQPGQTAADPQNCCAGLDLLPADHGSSESHTSAVGGEPHESGQGGPDGRSAGLNPLPTGQPVRDTHFPTAGGELSQANALLLIYADALDDIEATRIASENRVRALVQVKGLDGTPEQQRLTAIVESLAAIEHGVELELKRALRRHPFGPWVKSTTGIGEKQGARLLAAIGDPYMRPAMQRPDGTIEPARPRLVSELWAYCGYHVVHPAGQTKRDLHSLPVGGVAPSHQRGQASNWNSDAKKRGFLVAESCMKNRGSSYREVYEQARLKYADAVHQQDCRRCGPSGHPAPAGSPLGAGHQHARALRLVAKAILRDLWAEGRRLHEEVA